MKHFAILTSVCVIGLAVINAQGAAISYNFDTDQAYGKTVLNTSGNNLVAPGAVFTFDASTKAEGSAALRMQGTNGQAYGNLAATLDVGSISANESTQDLNGNGTTFTFQLRTDNTLGTLLNTEILPDIRLYAGGTLSAPDDLVARFYRTNLDDTADGQFVTIEQVIKDAGGALGPGYQTGYGDITKLNAVKYIEIVYSWSSASAPSGDSTFDVHLDDFQLSGPNVTAVPEPGTVSAAAGVMALGLSARRRRRTH